MTTKSVLYLTGGGTGGHLFPGIAIARRWRELHPEIELLFVGSTRPAEARILAQQNFRHIPLPTQSSAGLRRHPLRFIWGNMRSMWRARSLLARRNCIGIVGLGGYASAPLLFAARTRNIPYLLLEQNALPGRANRLLAPSAAVVCCAFEEAVPQFRAGTKAVVTGTPLRQEIAELASLELVPESAEERRLLVLGGSLGAVAVNSLMLAAVERLPALRDWTILHQTGEEDAPRIRKAYAQAGQPHEVHPFLADIAVEYRRSAFVVARAGGVTLSELACAGRGGILVPLPTAADGHQHANARHFERHAAAIIVEQATPLDSSFDPFCQALAELLARPSARTTLRTNMRSLAQPAATQLIIDHMQRAFLSAP